MERRGINSRELKAKRRQRGTDLTIDSITVLPDEIVRRVIDDSIVPALVEKYLREKKIVPGTKNQPHNEEQPL
jgi:hypothetical protein